MANRNRRRRWLFIILLLIAIAVIGGLIISQRGPEGTRVFTEEVQKRNIQETVAASGKVFPTTEVKISSDVSGEIVELSVEEGDSVVQGQLLAKVDPEAFQSQVQRGVATVNSAKAQLANARSQVQSMKAQKAQIQAQLQNATEIHERNEGLYDNGVISEADFQASLSNQRSLEANLAAAEANLAAAEQSAEAARFNVESSQASLEELRTSLSRTTIYSPVNGIVSLLNVEKGERVVGTIQMAGTEMMRIANLNAMEVRVEVSENDIPRVNLGDVAEIEIDAYTDRKFRGTVTQIANSSTNAATAEATLTSDQVTNFEVRIDIDPASYQDLISPNKPYPFRPGMSASVEIFTQLEKDAISLPIQAVTTREPDDDAKGKPQAEEEITDDLLEVVFVVDADTVRMIEVRTGIQDDSYIHIRSGLESGQTVVIGPYTAVARELKQGQKVNVVSEDEYYEDGGE